MYKCLITVGAGFIGSHLVDTLIEKTADIIVLDNFSSGRPQNLDHVKDEIKIIESDISQPGQWQDLFEGVDKVFHLAALADIVPSIENPENYYLSNVNGIFNVLEACRKHNVKKFVYSASSSCYGIPDESPTQETAPEKDNNNYFKQLNNVPSSPWTVDDFSWLNNNYNDEYVLIERVLKDNNIHIIH